MRSFLFSAVPWVILASGVFVADACSSSDAAGDPPFGTGGGGGNMAAPVVTAQGGPAGSGGASNDENGSAGSSPLGAGGMPDKTCKTAEVRTFYMSADDSASMGSAAYARELLNAGKAPPPGAIRSYEMLNYYRVRYPAPNEGQLGLHAHLLPDTPDHFRFQVGVQAPSQKTRPRYGITFVVDTSGSISGEGMVRARAALTAVASKLQSGDTVNLVKWSNEDAVVLEGHPVAGTEDPKLLAAISALAPAGGSDMHAGLARGYGLARDHRVSGLNRLILISDGGANLGVLDEANIAEQARQAEADEIFLVGVGVGPAEGYSDALMNAVTDAGRGAYVYLDRAAEAERVLGARFDEVVGLAARDVQIAVTLPAYLEIESFYGEHYSTNVEDVAPQHLAPDSSMVLTQILKNAKADPLCDDDEISVQITWSHPAFLPASDAPSASFLRPISDVMADSPQMKKATAIVAYATALQTPTPDSFHAAQKAAADALAIPELGDDKDLMEVSRLLTKHPKYVAGN